MPIVVARPDFERTLLTCVQNIVVGIGETKPSTVDYGDEKHITAALAVNDAQVDIYTATQWDFRFTWGVITLEDQIMWYPLPQDYSEAATDFPVYLGTAQLEYMDFRELLRRYPDFRMFPAGSGANLQIVQQAVLNTHHFGEPLVYTVVGEQIGFWPIPDEDWVSTQGQALYGYYNLPADMMADGDLLILPKNLWSAHYWLSLAYLKEYLEYPDWQADEARGQRRLQQQILRRNLRHRQNLAFKQDLVRE